MRVDSLDPHEDIHSGDSKTEGRAGGLAWPFLVPTAPKAPHPLVVPDPLPQLALVILTRFPPRVLLSVSVGPCG